MKTKGGKKPYLLKNNRFPLSLSFPEHTNHDCSSHGVKAATQESRGHPTSAGFPASFQGSGVDFQLFNFSISSIYFAIIYLYTTHFRKL